MDQRLLAAPHGFSQRATSFIASWCQGIHRTPFSCSQPRGCKVRTQHPHLAQEPSNLLLRRKDLFPSTGSHRTSSMGSLLCRLIRSSCENNYPAETDAPSSTSILFTLLNTSGCGDLVFTHLLRSDLQPARPDAPNPDSHVKRTKPAPSTEGLGTRATIARITRKGAAQCSHDLIFPPRRSPLRMEVDGIEPTTPCLQSRCSPTELHPQETQTDESSLVLSFKKELLFAKRSKNFHSVRLCHVGRSERYRSPPRHR